MPNRYAGIISDLAAETSYDGFLRRGHA